MSLTCRFCKHPVSLIFADLGMSPMANSYVRPERADAMEPFYPLKALVCPHCFLVQLGEFETPAQIFSDYAYFSSYSESWLKHCETYAEQAIRRFNLGKGSHVMEIASNDGYMLQYFKAQGIPVLGIEPAANVAAVAQEKGIPTRVRFFGTQTATGLASEGHQADLLIANNVLAHVPDLNDFVQGIQKVLKPSGVFTIEFPHLLQLIRQNQFDTIYHEHFSYFSLLTVRQVFARFGLSLFDVEELPTHGGSLRIYGCHSGNPAHPVSTNIPALLQKERDAGLERIDTYPAFNAQIRETKRRLLSTLIDIKATGKRIAAYGAPAKGNTLLNYCGIGTDFIDYTVDKNPHKQSCLLPGSRIPIYPPDKIREARPDYILILPWNLKEEVMAQLSYIREWNARFIVPIPQAVVID